MRDVSGVCSREEPTETGLAVMKTHAHMTSCPDGHLVFKGVCLMYEVWERPIGVRDRSACDIGLCATGGRRGRPGDDRKGSRMRRLLQNIDQKHVVSVEKILYKILSEIVFFREWAAYNDRKCQVTRSSEIVELVQAESRPREFGEGGNALP